MHSKTMILIIAALSTIPGLLGRFPSHQKCANENCSEVISYGQTILNYQADHKNVLSFQSGEKVTVLSKADGHWGVKIRGKFGYVPHSFVRETKVVTRTLPFSVPISDGIGNQSSEPATAAIRPSDDSVDTLHKIRMLHESFMDKEPGNSKLNILKVPNIDSSPADIKQYLTGNLVEEDEYLEESLVVDEKLGDRLNRNALENGNIDSVLFNDSEILKENLVDDSVERALEDSLNNRNKQHRIASTINNAEVHSTDNNPSVNYTISEELAKKEDAVQKKETIKNKTGENLKDEKAENVDDFIESIKDGYTKEIESEVLLKSEENLNELPAENLALPKDINIMEANSLVDEEKIDLKFNQTINDTVSREPLKNQEYSQDRHNHNQLSTEIDEDEANDLDDIEGFEHDDDEEGDPYSEDEDMESFLDSENQTYEESLIIRPEITESTKDENDSDLVNENQNYEESKNFEEVEKGKYLESSISLSQGKDNLDTTISDNILVVHEEPDDNLNRNASENGNLEKNIDSMLFNDSEILNENLVDASVERALENQPYKEHTSIRPEITEKMVDENDSYLVNENQNYEGSKNSEEIDKGTHLESAISLSQKKDNLDTTRYDKSIGWSQDSDLSGQDNVDQSALSDSIDSSEKEGGFLSKLTTFFSSGVLDIDKETSIKKTLENGKPKKETEKDQKIVTGHEESLDDQLKEKFSLDGMESAPVDNNSDKIVEHSDNIDPLKSDYKLMSESIPLEETEEMTLDVDTSVEGLPSSLKDYDSISTISQSDEKPLSETPIESTPLISSDTGSEMAEYLEDTNEELLIEGHITDDVNPNSSFSYDSFNHQDNGLTPFVVSVDPVENVGEGRVINRHETLGEAHSIHNTDQQNSLSHGLSDDPELGLFVDNDSKAALFSDSRNIQHNTVEKSDSIIPEPIPEVQGVLETQHQELFSHSIASEYHQITNSESESSVAPDGYCDAANQICDSSVFSHQKSLLCDNVGKEEFYSPDESGMLSDIFVPPKTDLLILLISVGTGIAVLLVLLETVKIYFNKAGLVKKFNTLQSQLEQSLREIKVLNNEKTSIEKKKISLQEKFCEVEDCSQELRNKIEELMVENDLFKKEKAVWDQRFHELFSTSEEQGKMNDQLLTMQDELVAEKTEIESLLTVKEQESDTYRKELIDLRENYSTMEIQLANALEKTTQAEAAEAKCSQLLSEKCQLQIAVQSLKGEKSMLECSLNDEKLESRSLKALLNQLQSMGGSVPAGQMDALLDVEKIRREMKFTEEECVALKKQLSDMDNAFSASQRINEELKLKCENLESRLAIEVEDKTKLKNAIDVLKNLFETEKAELVEKLTMYKGVSDSESSIIKKFEQKLDQAKANEGMLHQTIKDLTNQIHEFDLVAKEQTESYTTGMRQATQQAVDAQIKNRRLETRNQELDRECANLRRKLTEMAMRDANSNVSTDDIGTVLLTGNHDTSMPPQQPGLLPLGYPPLPPFMPPFLPPPGMSFMDRPSTLGMGSPPFDSPYYDDRATPNSMRAFSPRSHSPTGSERSGSYRRRRDYYRPESVGRSRDSSPTGNTYDRRRGRSPSDRDV